MAQEESSKSMNQPVNTASIGDNKPIELDNTYWISGDRIFPCTPDAEVMPTGYTEFRAIGRNPVLADITD